MTQTLTEAKDELGRILGVDRHQDREPPLARPHA